MTKQIPFPPALKEISARNSERSYDTRRNSQPATHKVDQLAAYKTACGLVRTAYDLYNPTYPEGAESGLADVTFHLKHGMGYHPVCENFKMATEILQDAPEWDSVAIAWVKAGEVEGFIIASNEMNLQSVIDNAALDAKAVQRFGRQNRYGLGNGQTPTVGFILRAAGGNELHISSDEPTLVRELVGRYRLNGLDVKNLADISATIMERGGKYGCTISYGPLDPENALVQALADRAIDRSGPGF